MRTLLDYIHEHTYVHSQRVSPIPNLIYFQVHPRRYNDLHVFQPPAILSCQRLPVDHLSSDQCHACTCIPLHARLVAGRERPYPHVLLSPLSG